MAVPVAIGLGSNLGDRIGHLRTAVRRLEPLLAKRCCSAVYESEPMYVTEQPCFLNACCVGETKLGARPLVDALRELERRAGRTPGGPRFGPRVLDLDLLLYGGSVIEETGLRVPHPRMRERPFVIWPLAEIAGDWLHPEMGESIAGLADGVPREGLRPVAPPLCPVAS